MGAGLWWERVAGAAIALVGVALTTTGTLGHVPALDAPGATAIVVGSSWLGVAAARRATAPAGGRAPRGNDGAGGPG